ncbi:recombinase family protein, partial [Mycobacterium sp.]|uniref:recombinase family protein n=1 Tax=Mycobacterium sp. TaxID=1785 RepID=UPI003C710C2D
GLAALMEYVREGDTVVVWKLDRLGRNTLHILETVKALTDRGVTLVSTSDGIDSNTAADPAHVATARRMKADGHTARDAARYLGVSRATLYRYLADEAA